MHTPFEQSGSENWTSLDDGYDFLHALADASDIAEVTQLGLSTQGRPIYALAVGAPAPRLRSRPVALHVAGQHGNERAGIECAIAQARDLAMADDPDTLTYLEEVTWLVMPFASPDTVGRKFNDDGVDLNRDHVNKVTAEARTIARVLHTYQPTITIDSHAAHFSYDIMAAPPTNGLGIHPAVVAAARGALAATDTALTDQGRWFNEFAGNSTIRETLRNAAAFGHSPTILLEINRDNSPAQGVADAKIFMDAVQAHHAEHLATFTSAAQTSRHHLAPPLVIDLAGQR